MLITGRSGWMLGGAGLVVTLAALLTAPAQAQVGGRQRDYRDRFSRDSDQYGNRYRDRVFGQNGYASDIDEPRAASRRRADSSDEDDASFSEAYPYVPRSRRPWTEEAREEAEDDVVIRRQIEDANRYRRSNDGVVRNDYAGAPVHRHYYGGVDRYDSPGYLDGAGRASALSNGYSRRGVAEFHDGYGRGVRTNDVYPLQRDVDPRRYRGRDLNGSISADGEGGSGPQDIEDFIRAEMSVRPGANLRVSSTGTWTMRNYLDQGNQVNARFRLPVHKRWAYGRGP